MSTNKVNRLTAQEKKYINEHLRDNGISVNGGSVEGDTLYIDLKNKLGNCAVYTKAVKEILKRVFPDCERIIVNGTLTTI